MRQVERLAASRCSRSIPEKVTGKGDMFPAHRGGMGKETVGHRSRGRSQMLDGGVHVDCVPIDDSGDDQVEAGCPILLGLMAAVDDAALTESVDGTVANFGM